MAATDDFPRDGSPDATLALLREGYGFIPRRCARAGGPAVHTRLMLRDALLLTGPEAVAMVYSSPGLTRRGAMPFWVLRLLQDHASVQQLDGAAHRSRKRVFLEILVEGRAAEDLSGRFATLWTAAARARPARFEVLRGVSGLLAAAACDWAGLPPGFAAPGRAASVLYAMSDRAGGIGPATWAALLARARFEARLRDVVHNFRVNGDLQAQTPLARLARLVDAAGEPLSDDAVAVELLNLLRPVVAVGRYIAFAAAALHQHPDWRARIAAGEDSAIAPFCAEVRRLAPFFPFTAAVATEDIPFRGTTIAAGQWILADLYGTCRDPAAFPEPEAFRPDRDWNDPRVRAALIPQGGGDPAAGHRCPGEAVTLALMETAVRLLCRDVDYTLPPQDLRVRLNRIPARPESGIVLAGLRLR